jgi:hypothetical protein
MTDDPRFRFPVCLGCFDKEKHKPSYRPSVMMEGCARERVEETIKLYGVPMERCCICGGQTIASLYVKEDPR